VSSPLLGARPPAKDPPPAATEETPAVATEEAAPAAESEVTPAAEEPPAAE